MVITVASFETSRARRIGYYGALVAGLVLVVFGLGELLFLGIVGWAGESALEQATESGAGVHLFHVLAHAWFAWLLLISLAVQFRHPERRFAAAIFALAAMITYTLGTLMAGIFDPLEGVAILVLGAAVWLNPGREEAEATPFHRRALVAAIPLSIGAVALAVGELDRQVSGVSSDPHVEFGHHGLMAAIAIMIVLAAIIGSSSLTGRRLSAGLAVGGLLYMGVASLLFSNQTSSLGFAGGAVTMAAGLLYGWGALSPSRPETPPAR